MIKPVEAVGEWAGFGGNQITLIPLSLSVNSLFGFVANSVNYD